MESAISVVATDGGSTAVWRVSLLPGHFGEMIGAWVLPVGDPRIDVVAAGSARVAGDQRMIDAFRAELVSLLQALGEAFAAYQDDAEPLAGPAWPAPPDAPPVPPSPDRPEVAERALVRAQAVAMLLRAWADAEEERARLALVVRARAQRLAGSLEGGTLTSRRRQRLERQLRAAEAALAGPLGQSHEAPTRLLTQEPGPPDTRAG